MLITPKGTFPLVGRRHGQIFTAPGSLNIGRTRVVPLQPRSNAAVSRTIAVATVAQWWKLLTPADQATWADLFVAGSKPYNNFVMVNSNAVQWGGTGIIETPYLAECVTPEFLQIYAEPDGVHMTLISVLSAPPAPEAPSLIHVYINFVQAGTRNVTSKSAATYFGTFSGTNMAVLTYFDITDLWMAAAGRWSYPGSTNTVTQMRCGNSFLGYFWATDPYGMPREKPDQGPLGSFVSGPLPGLIGPTACPPVAGPPYPWAFSH